MLLSLLVLIRCSYVARGLTRGWEVMHFNHGGRGSLDTRGVQLVEWVLKFGAWGVGTSSHTQKFLLLL